jgi:hypothetical protein
MDVRVIDGTHPRRPRWSLRRTLLGGALVGLLAEGLAHGVGGQWPLAALLGLAGGSLVGWWGARRPQAGRGREDTGTRRRSGGL